MRCRCLGSAPFLVVNGDVWTDIDFGSLRRDPPAQSLAHLVFVPNPPQHARGDFLLENGLVSEGEGPRHTYSGVGIYRPELFAGCEPGKFPLLPLLRGAIARRALSGELHAGRWYDIGTTERLAALDAQLSSTRFSREALMKKIVTVAVVLAALLIGAPWGIGKLAERHLDHGLDKLVEAAPYLAVVERKYTPGWFKSEQVVTFEAFGPMDDSAEPQGRTNRMRFTVRNEVPAWTRCSAFRASALRAWIRTSCSRRKPARSSRILWPENTARSQHAHRHSSVVERLPSGPTAARSSRRTAKAEISWENFKLTWVIRGTSTTTTSTASGRSSKSRHGGRASSS